ncbi:MAG: ABC transporter permease [Bacteroidales bacterium]|nr:ABC transporter permease [Bacteroidales bacterium]
MEAFIKKEFFHIFRDVRSMMILFGMPIVQLLVFGFAISTELNNAGIAIYDQSRDPMSKQLVQKIVSSGYFELQQVFSTNAEIEAGFKSGKIKAAIVIGKDFEKHFIQQDGAQIQIIADASDPNTASIISNYLQGITRAFQAEKLPNLKLPVEIKTESRLLYNPEMRSVFMFVPGTIAIILMLVSAMMTSISIAREKETGTMEILLASPLKPWQIILGKVTPYVILSFINAMTIVVVAWLVFEMPIKGSFLLLMGEAILFIVMSLTLGILISTVSPTQQVAMLLSMFALMLPTILLSGFIFPIENMPVVLQGISNIMPSRWFIIIMKSIMVKGSGFMYVWKETLIILGMTVFFGILSIKKFKIRLS